MEAVGEALLSAFLELLLGKLKYPSDLLKYARQEQVHRELKKWEETLSEMLQLLNVAEDKQINDPSVKAWLARLRDLAYDMEDVLDEFAYEALRRKVMAETDGEGSTSKVRRFFPTCCTTFIPTKTIRNVKMGSKITEISGRLEEISAQKAGLGLKPVDKVEIITQSTWERRSVTSCEVYVPWVKGRDADKQIIIEMLLKDEPAATNVSVVSIVAMGGMGKTTLAKLVYDDAAEPIANHFALKAWVCVSNEFDKVRVTKTLLNSLSSQSSSSEDFHEIQSQLKKALTGKRFLIVLDDLWSDIYSKWDDLRSPFLEGAPGSKILVTTRDRGVATWMGGHKNLHELKKLSDGDCWSVFQTHAFQHMNLDEHQNLEAVGRRIVEKCGGLPLAAKALGGLLRSEPREREWERVLHSKIWDLPPEKCDIIPALRLSYNHLPSHLKRCFAYCAVFPQDYEFRKEELILLWMAEGFIHQSNDDVKMEDLGDNYFCELLSRSFFQLSNNNKSRFVMHDLINDLAKSIAGDTCLHLDVELENDFQHSISPSTRHSSFIRQNYDIFKKFERFYKKEPLRTFIALPIYESTGEPIDESISKLCFYISNKVLEELIPRLGHLRVLSLSDYMINEIPDSFGKLIQLRYLDFSNTEIKWLPDSIGNLFFLQTLKLSRCRNLTMLPTSIGNLINLRHVDVTGAVNLQEMPLQIGKLKNLQILSNFIVGKNRGLEIKELKDLSQLRGELCISKLENVVNIQDARDAGLKLKHNLESLIMRWSSELDGSRSETNQMDVLDSLRPCFNLNKLRIRVYDGPKFPHWIGDASFSKMVDLSLMDCRKCTSLPCLGQLPSLKQLRIQGMDGVEKVGAEFYGESSPAMRFFPSLESLHFVGMSEWECWEDCSSPTESLFPCLRELTIGNCPKLIKKLPTYFPSLTKLFIYKCPKLEFPLSRLPSLKELVVRKCNETVLRSGIDLTSLTNLKIAGILGLIKLQQGFVQLLRGLQALKIWECEELTCLWEDGFESENLHCHQLVSLGCNLRSLEISQCDNLERLPNGWQSLICLEELTIMTCPKLVSFPEAGFPPRLRSLTLFRCEGLKCLPDGMMDMCALEYLCIAECPSLIGFPKGGLPTTLKELCIRSCRKLESLPVGIMHHHSTNAAALQILRICQCSSLTSFPRGKFPSALKNLHIEDCEQLESISEEMFHPTNNSLQSLTITNYPNLKALPDCLYNLTHLSMACLKNLELLPPQIKNLTRLTSLDISHCENIKTPLSQWGLTRLTSLTYLSIGDMFLDATCFSDDHRSPLLPITLTTLSISQFQNLESLSSLSLQTLTSLKHLYIHKCPKLLLILPRDGLLPDTLSQIYTSSCPRLKQRYSKEEGDDWPKIAHIPRVSIC